MILTLKRLQKAAFDPEKSPRKPPLTCTVQCTSRRNVSYMQLEVDVE
jgi:hypothetical protein